MLIENETYIWLKKLKKKKRENLLDFSSSQNCLQTSHTVLFINQSGSLSRNLPSLVSKKKKKGEEEGGKISRYSKGAGDVNCRGSGKVPGNLEPR